MELKLNEALARVDKYIAIAQAVVKAVRTVMAAIG